MDPPSPGCIPVWGKAVQECVPIYLAYELPRELARTNEPSLYKTDEHRAHRDGVQFCLSAIFGSDCLGRQPPLDEEEVDLVPYDCAEIRAAFLAPNREKGLALVVDELEEVIEIFDRPRRHIPADGVQPFLELLEYRVEQVAAALPEEVVLVFEIPVERGAIDSRPLGDMAHEYRFIA